MPSASARLYTPDMLVLAAGLAEFPLDPGMALRAEGRSRTCGSQLVLGLCCDPDGRIERIGLKVSACAVGQASAALLARGCAGKDEEAMTRAGAAIACWLAEDGALPDWPGFDLLVCVKAHPGRHGALLLPWTTACEALSHGALAR